MSLNLGETIEQVNRLAARQRSDREDRTLRIASALNAMTVSTADDVKEKLARVQRRPFLWAGAAESLGAAHDPPELPSDFAAISTDGSHIDVDRHLPVPCALINIGGCSLQYGSQPRSFLFNRPHLYSGDELFLTEQAASVTEVAIEGNVLGLKRTVDELQALLPLIQDLPQDLPALALMDGSLILWQFSGPDMPKLVKEELFDKGFLPAMDALQEASSRRPLALASYVSMPRSTNVVNTLRLYLCATSNDECNRICSGRRSPTSPCSMVNHLLDRELFETLLAPGQRSTLFSSNSVVMNLYRDHQVFLFYVNNGWEIGRVEVPKWVADDEALLSLTHALVLDQCRRGLGYPVAISEAHEQAVVTSPDRRAFQDMLLGSLGREALSTTTSQKSRSKRSPWL